MGVTGTGSAVLEERGNAVAGMDTGGGGGGGGPF